MAQAPRVDGRRERSRLTRARIVDAATSLFVDGGYLATTVEAIAARAGVAVQTVYYVFGTKRNLLAAALDAGIAGDTAPAAVLERPWVDELRATSDARAAVELLVEATVPILARAAPIYEVVRTGSADPDLRALLGDIRRRRREDQRALVEILRRSGHLRPDLDAATAADVFYALMNEDVFGLLTGDCGWELEQFRSWATSLMEQQLIVV